VGYEIVPDWRLADYDKFLSLRALMDRFDVDCVLDVGTHRGPCRDFLGCHLSYVRRTVLFEPRAELHAALCVRAASDPRWQVEGCAPDSEDGELVMNMLRNSSFNFFLAPVPEAVRMTHDGNEVVARRRVPVRRLDGFLDGMHGVDLGRILLKLDAHGFDRAVVEGAGAHLGQMLLLLTEIPMPPIHRDMPDGVAVVATSREREVDVAGMFLVPGDDDMRVVEYDCLFLNRGRLNLKEGVW
jgi:FkbM family methyltransferase